MFLLISTFLFSIQWLGSPWQLGILKTIVSCMFFITIIIISIVPAMNREWKTYIKSIIVCALLQLVFMFFTFILPGVGLLIMIIYNIILYIISKKLPVSFTNNIKTGILFIILWFAGINHFLGNYILTDPRGVWSGDLYFQLTDWVILLIFIAALIRTIYHIKTNFLETPDSQTDDNQINAEKKAHEKKTLIPVLIASVSALALSAFIPLPWQIQAGKDLKAGFAAFEANDLEGAQLIAQKYYNDKKILHNGDVFYLNGLVNEEESPKKAAQFFLSAASWYKNHKSLVSQSYHSDSQVRLILIYMNSNPPEYYKARDAVKKALKKDPENSAYLELQTEVTEKLAQYEKDLSFFRRLWSIIKSKF